VPPPASPDSLPPLGELIADEPFWRYPIGPAGEGVAHLRVWRTVGPEPGHLAVVTETGSAGEATESAGHIWAELARGYGPSLVLLEHHPAPEAGEGAETLDRRAVDGRRDEAVRAAAEAGLTKSEIHWLTGIARSTLDRILGTAGGDQP
jgi:hypothetical protein